MIEIDGSMGEGGGQVLRTSLTLSAVTGQAVHFRHIRQGRPKPGLMRQHLVAVKAAQAICGATVQGAELGSRELKFSPGRLCAGSHHFQIGSAGSASLVLQTVAPALMTVAGESHLVIEGGTHNEMAPPFEFLDQTWLPGLRSAGADMELTLIRPGFYPAGGGEIRAVIRGGRPLRALILEHRGPLLARTAVSLSANLEAMVSARQSSLFGSILGFAAEETALRSFAKAVSVGNCCQVHLSFERHSETFTAFGSRGRPSEELVQQLKAETEAYLSTDAPVGEHLADQWLLPLALNQGGTFRASAWSEHAKTNAEVIQRFLAVKVTAEQVGSAWQVTINA